MFKPRVLNNYFAEFISPAKMPKINEDRNLDDITLRSVGFGYENNCRNSNLKLECPVC
jgi:hypothetical protein